MNKNKPPLGNTYRITQTALSRDSPEARFVCFRKLPNVVNGLPGSVHTVFLKGAASPMGHPPATHTLPV